MAARKTSISAWNRPSAESKYRMEYTRAAVTSAAANVATPAPTGSIENEIPTVTMWLGRQPPIQ
jgi:hypothetical protein